MGIQPRNTIPEGIRYLLDAWHDALPVEQRAQWVIDVLVPALNGSAHLADVSAYRLRSLCVYYVERLYAVRAAHLLLVPRTVVRDAVRRLDPALMVFVLRLLGEPLSSMALWAADAEGVTSPTVTAVRFYAAAHDCGPRRADALAKLYWMLHDVTVPPPTWFAPATTLRDVGRVPTHLSTLFFRAVSAGLAPGEPERWLRYVEQLLDIPWQAWTPTAEAELAETLLWEMLERQLGTAKTDINWRYAVEAHDLHLACLHAAHHKGVPAREKVLPLLVAACIFGPATLLRNVAGLVDTAPLGPALSYGGMLDRILFAIEEATSASAWRSRESVR